MQKQSIYGLLLTFNQQSCETLDGQKENPFFVTINDLMLSEANMSDISSCMEIQCQIIFRESCKCLKCKHANSAQSVATFLLLSII